MDALVAFRTVVSSESEVIHSIELQAKVQIGRENVKEMPDTYLQFLP